MGIGDWIKKTFGKQPCAFCGNEVGMLKRDKIKNKEFICSDCKCTCSRYIQVYRMTKDELLGNMEYMKRQDRLYREILGKPTHVMGDRMAIEFFDDAGMLRIREWNWDDRYPKELIRYDQIASYEPFCNESEPSEPGKPKTFDNCGVRITLVGNQTDTTTVQKGLRPHPYIEQELEVEVSNRDKHAGMLEVNQIIGHLNFIFGVHDDTKGLFDFGPSKQRQRELDAMKAMGGMFKEAIQAAKDGEVSEEAQAKVQDAMNKVEDAATSGLARYSRLADEAEAKI